MAKLLSVVASVTMLSCFYQLAPIAIKRLLVLLGWSLFSESRIFLRLLWFILIVFDTFLWCAFTDLIHILSMIGIVSTSSRHSLLVWLVKLWFVMPHWVWLTSLSSDSRSLSSTNTWLLYLLFGIRIVLLELIWQLLIYGIEIFLLAVMIGKIISIVDSLELSMSLQLSGSYQRLFLDDVDIHRLCPTMKGSPHILHLIGCQTSDLCKLTLPLMEKNELFAWFNLLVCLLVADIQMGPFTYTIWYFGEEVFSKPNLGKMGLNWQWVVQGIEQLLAFHLNNACVRLALDSPDAIEWVVVYIVIEGQG